MEKIQYVYKTPVNTLYVVASPHGLEGVFFNKQSFTLVQQIGLATPAEQVLTKTINQLNEYFGGQRKIFDLPVNPEGTTFQQDVWKAVARIPFGQTMAYRDIARMINKPKAVRAVGSAIGKNPLGIIIPCHRIIAADGSLGGYAGGLGVKRQLLALEQG